jgi:TfoX/Sxy family transcriptional regulator of competence genes
VAYDEDLADRVRALFAGRTGVREQKMFGGLAFMLHGNMACGLLGNEVIVRVGKENLDDALSQPHARPFDMTGRPMRGFIYVAAESIATDDGLATWAGKGVAYAEGLPPK